MRDQIISGDPIETVLLTYQDVAQWKAQYQIEASPTQKQSFETAFAENVPPASWAQKALKTLNNISPFNLEITYKLLNSNDTNSREFLDWRFTH